MNKYLLLLLFPFFLGCAAVSQDSKIDELNDPQWSEVPGTQSEWDPSGQFSDPVFIDVKNVIRIVDLINSDASYTRLEVNCNTEQFRAIRMGYFESKTRVNYVDYDDEAGIVWESVIEPHDQAVMASICQL